MTTVTQRLSVAGTAKVVRFNWPKYALVGAILGAAFVGSTVHAPLALRTALWIVGTTGSLWVITSLISTWWVYDRRRVYDHLTVGLDQLGEWASVHAGFDDATPALASTIGSPPTAVIELAMPASSSLRRAREGDRIGVRIAPIDALPFATGALDTIFVTFAVHEVRDRTDQQALFTELRRVLRPGGRLVVTEHLRDLANLAVYGPGAFHFQRATVWNERAAEAGFIADTDTTITPFVHRITWQR